jgi:hypothetical protein
MLRKKIEKLRKNKKGWIEVVEVFISILLISTIVLMIIEKNSVKEENEFSEMVYYKQLSILREIETNTTLRQEVLSIENLPVDWRNIPENIKNKVIQRTPINLECVLQICSDFCSLFEDINKKEIYSQSVKVFSLEEEKTIDRTLYLYCWKK